MVHFIAPLIGAAALLSKVTFAAPVPNPPSYAPPADYSPPAPQNQYAPPAEYSPPAAQYSPPPVMEMSKPPMPESSMMSEPPMSEPAMSTTMYEPPKPTEVTPPPSHDAPPPYTPPVYGSGGGNYGSDYEDCVSKCLATYAAPPTSWTPPPTKVEPGAPAGNGKTHTVLVAPTQGVLRYVPPMLNVPTGDTIRFIWNGGKTNHTVSRSSQLEMCNRTKDSFFTSGVQSGDFSFTQVVNDTAPIFFYCSVGQHCAKGMFGIVNPKQGAPASNKTVEVMMPQWTAEYPDLAAAWKTIHNTTQGTPADTWGNKMDVSDIPPAQYKGLAENIMYYRSFLAANPGVQDLDAGASLPAGVTEFKIPSDLSSLLTATSADPNGAGNVAAGAAPTGSPTGAAPSTSSLTAGAGSLKSSGLMVAFVAVAATFFAL